MCIEGLAGKHEERNHLKDPAVDGRIILKWIVRKWDPRMDGIDLAQEKDR
jgi:hypothetical protein